MLTQLSRQQQEAPELNQRSIFTVVLLRLSVRLLNSICSEAHQYCIPLLVVTVHSSRQRGEAKA